MNESNRNITIDIMKGWGILLVVLSHSIVINSKTDLILFNNGLFNMIQSFFMPMFFLISGYLTYNKVGNWDWAKKHMSKWFLPLVMFTLIYFVCAQLFPNLVGFRGLEGMSFPDYIVNIVTGGFSGLVLWYLWTLVLCYFVAYELENGRLRLKVPFIIQFISAIVLMNLIPSDQLGLFSLKWYGIYFLIGYALHHYSVNKKLSYIALIAFPLCVYLFNWMILYQSLEWGSFGRARLFPAIMNGHASLIGVMFLMAFLGIAFVYAISVLIKWKPMVKILSYLGSASIGIYLIHIIFVGITDNYWLSTILATIISVVLYEVLKRIKFVNYILFGGTPIKIQIARRLV